MSGFSMKWSNSGQTKACNPSARWTLQCCSVLLTNSTPLNVTSSFALEPSLMTADKDQFGNNRMLTIDTDSSFWVCDNSAMGNIFSDIKQFHGKLVLSVYIVGARTGTISPYHMDTVIIWLIDDKGIHYTHEGLPSEYSLHETTGGAVFWRKWPTWCRWDGNPFKIQYSRTNLEPWEAQEDFSTAGSGLPECLFNTGYSRFQTYTSRVGKYYDNSTSWAFTSSIEPSQVSEGDTVTYKSERNVGDWEGLTLILNDGSCQPMHLCPSVGAI